jgi:hypothetical protein
MTRANVVGLRMCSIALESSTVEEGWTTPLVMNDVSLKRRRILNDWEMRMDSSNCYVENHVGRQIASQLGPFVSKLKLDEDGPLLGIEYSYNAQKCLAVYGDKETLVL